MLHTCHLSFVAVNLSSLDRSNRLISRCRYALDMDSNGNFIFRVHYSACNVQTQNGFHVLEIHMVRKSSRGNGRSDRYRMRCPAVTAAMGRETVRCDPNYIQVSRPMPLENTDEQDWFLLFRGEIEVSVGDASLIGVEIEMNKSHVTVKGLRDLLLSSREFLDRRTELLPLWIGHALYVYSLEASCPLVTRDPGAEIALHIPKQRMGLVKRGLPMIETLTLKNIVALHPINITVTENKHFVMVNAPAGNILRSQDCTTRDNRQGIRDFYSLDLVLEFAEIAHPMNWTLENYYECTVLTSDADQQETGSKNEEKAESSANNTTTGRVTEGNYAIQSNEEYPLSSGADLSRYDITSAIKKETELAFNDGSGEDLNTSGSGNDQEKSSDQISATQLAELGNITLNRAHGSRTLVTKQPGIPEYLQDKRSEISNVPHSNSTVTDESKNVRLSTNVTTTSETTTCSFEIGKKYKTSNMESSEEARRTVVTDVVGNGGSEASSEEARRTVVTDVIGNGGSEASSEEARRTTVVTDVVGNGGSEASSEEARRTVVTDVIGNGGSEASSEEARRTVVTDVIGNGGSEASSEEARRTVVTDVIGNGGLEASSEEARRTVVTDVIGNGGSEASSEEARRTVVTDVIGNGGSEASSEEARWTVVHSMVTDMIGNGGSEASSEEARRTVVTDVIGNGGSEASSAVVKQKNSTKPRNSQQTSSNQIPSSEKRPKDDADLWEALIGDALVELLDETTRDGFVSPMYRHRASRRTDTGALEKTKKEKVLQKTMDETSGSSVRRSPRDLQHTAEDGVLSRSHIDWRIYSSPHEDLLDNTISDIETIRSAEQLIVEE
ncbi:uncharacterized protein C1orf127 homolog [Phyllobates terribilis]|uniref:uncharacterized protein C1orf127 homolog n=1 Tax=Phyllobates terribilis TaxID=111132 RepID=UPI003CCAA056